MSEAYRRQRTTFGDYSGALLVTPLTGTTTLVSPKVAGSTLEGTGWTIYVQKIHIRVTAGQAATTWSVQDGAGVSLTGSLSAAAAPSTDTNGAEFDLGPVGIPLTAASALTFVPSAQGAAGIVSWEAYQRLTSAASSGFGV